VYPFCLAGRGFLCNLQYILVRWSVIRISVSDPKKNSDTGYRDSFFHFDCSTGGSLEQLPRNTSMST
jgi:hypothetical protein